MERPFLSVLLYDGANDPVATQAVRILRDLAEAGLIAPVWTVDAAGGPAHSSSVERTDHSGTQEYSGLLTGLAEAGPVRLAQVLTVVTAAVSDPEAVRELADRAAKSLSALREKRPTGTRVLDGRILFPTSLEEPTCIVALASAYADANLVVVPDDRESDEHFGSPVTLAQSDRFAHHVAAELASQAGLWAGILETPLEPSSAGVIGHGDAKVMVARSYARLLVGPPVPIDTAVASLEHLPIPHGLEPARDPEFAVGEAALAILRAHPTLLFHESDPYHPRVDFLRTGAAFRRLLREAGTYIRTIPSQLKSGVLTDLERISADALSAAIGEDAAIRVIWDDSQMRRPTETIDTFVEGVDAELDRLQRMRDYSPTGELWTSVIRSILGIADGGPLTTGVPRPNNHGRAAVIADPELLAPSVDQGPEHVAQILTAPVEPHADVAVDELTTSEDEATPDTSNMTASTASTGPRSAHLLEEVVAGVRRERDRARATVEQRRAELLSASDRFALRSQSDLGALGWLVGVLVASFATVLVVATGAAELVGADTWTTATRTSIGAVVAGVAVLVAAGSAVGAFKGHPENSSLLQRTLLGIALVGGVVIVSVVGSQTRLGIPLDRVHPDEAAASATVALVLLVTAVLSARLRTPSGDSAARAAGSALVVFVSLTIVGDVVRDGAWYDRIDAGSRRAWGLGVCALLASALVILLAWIAARRVQERLRLRDEAERLRWQAAVAVQAGRQLAALKTSHAQLVGSATSLARIMRRPFGELDRTPDLRLAEPSTLCAANKVRLERFELDDRTRDALIARVARQLADVGWIQHQYEVAVEAFRPELAMLRGRDVDELSRVRPEDDPGAELPDDHGALPPGDRWDFVRSLYSGRLDDALQRPLSGLAVNELLNGYLDTPQPIDGAMISPSSFARDLAATAPPPLSADIFSRQDLPVADDPRTVLTSRLWWPQDALAAPPMCEATDVMSSQVVDSREQGIMISFVRIDWSEPMPLSLLPITTLDRIRQPQNHQDDDQHPLM